MLSSKMEAELCRWKLSRGLFSITIVHIPIVQILNLWKSHLHLSKKANNSKSPTLILWHSWVVVNLLFSLLQEVYFIYQFYSNWTIQLNGAADGTTFWNQVSEVQPFQTALILMWMFKFFSWQCHTQTSNGSASSTL